MIFRVFLVFVFVQLCASFDNSSVFFDKIDAMSKSAFATRQGRLISFNTLDEGISVELDFSVPFITIPVKKSMALAQGSLVNINVGAIMLAGGLVVGVTILMPLLLGFFSKQLTIPSNWKPGYRSSTEGRPEIWSYIDNLISAHKIDPTSCMQKYICSAVSQSLMNIEKGKATSSDKIIDGIASNSWLTEQLHGTSMYFALKNGLDRKNCTDTYKACGASEELFESTLDAFRKFVLLSYTNMAN